MELFGKNLDREVAVVAEIGVNHEGAPGAAIDLLRLAAEAGADAVKFQTYSPSRYASASDPARLERVTKFALDEATHGKLAEESARLNVAVFSTPLTEDVVPMLDNLFPAFKIASGDLTFEPVIRATAKTGKPVILSTGLGTMDEIETAVHWFRQEVGEDNLRDRLILMHCVSAYPTPIEEANLRSIPYLAKKTGLRIGYSNHVIGLDASMVAVALGACIIEVHFTDQKTGREFRDHELSVEPDELRNLIETLPLVRASLGENGKKPMPCELPNKLATRKGIVAAREIAGNTELRRQDLMYARPASEFSATIIKDLIGKHTITKISKGELIQRNNIRENGR